MLRLPMVSLHSHIGFRFTPVTFLLFLISYWFTFTSRDVHWLRHLPVSIHCAFQFIAYVFFFLCICFSTVRLIKNNQTDLFLLLISWIKKVFSWWTIYVNLCHFRFWFTALNHHIMKKGVIKGDECEYPQNFSSVSFSL